MDYPFHRKTNDPEKKQNLFLAAPINNRTSDLLAYLDAITNRQKFYYIVIIIVVILVIYYLQLNWTIWVGLLCGIAIIYYLNERTEQELDTNASRVWGVIKSPLLDGTKYFVTDPELTQWVLDMKDMKKYNVLEFNQMIKSMDQLLKIKYNITKLKIDKCKENIDLFNDIRARCLNQFHSILHSIPSADIEDKGDEYFKRLGEMLNIRHDQLIKICQHQNIMDPVTIEKHLEISAISAPAADDPLFDQNYNFYN